MNTILLKKSDFNQKSEFKNVLNFNFSTHILFRCIPRKYAYDFLKGKIMLNQPKNWIKEEKNGKVGLGSTVNIKYIDDDEVDEYKIVGSQEADPFESKISNESPIAKAILNKKVGDIVEVESPNGSYKIEITYFLKCQKMGSLQNINFFM